MKQCLKSGTFKNTYLLHPAMSDDDSASEYETSSILGPKSPASQRILRMKQGVVAQNVFPVSNMFHNEEPGT